MYSISLLLLLAGANYPDGSQAAAGRLARRQSTGPVELWGACNYPSQGINGPLPCADGSECICKDDTYAQCRQQIDGSWAPDPSWQCQQPGSSPSGSSGSNTPSTTDDNSGGSTGTEQSSSNSDTPATNADKSGDDTGNVPVSQDNTSQNSNSDGSTPSSDSSNQSSGTGAGGGSQAATVGDCTMTSPPSGFDGVASISYYGWQGSACDCGQNSWEWSTGSGVYNGAVNQKLFQGTLNSAGQPNCGSACGQCFELSTSGFNAYNGGVGSGSTITLQIVDACYGSGGNWCGSTSDDYKDSSSCYVHFDIQTGPPGTNGQSPVGSDGRTWNGGGQIVYYRPTACPQTLTSSYKSSCTC